MRVARGPDVGGINSIELADGRTRVGIGVRKQIVDGVPTKSGFTPSNLLMWD
ncbi:MAG TPA: hypothetical protein PL001_01940 [Candidatus Kryptobacter bacterium]|nr:hypothetical protein [Candidatus Kryptobacter bacterium]